MKARHECSGGQNVNQVIKLGVDQKLKLLSQKMSMGKRKLLIKFQEMC